MKLVLASGAALFLIGLPCRAQTAKEWKLDLAQYGLIKAPCNTYMGRVEFLDDDHLVVSAPVADTCDKGNWGKPIDTRITEIDLQGREVATTRRADAACCLASGALCAELSRVLLSQERRIALLE